MMKSEHAGQRNLQQSGAAGQRNTQHAKEMKAEHAPGKKQEECEESKEYLWQQ